MTNKLYDETSIQATANAIRTRSGDNTQMYKVEDFADAINAIPRPSGTRSVTQNGTFDVEDKQFVSVNVEGGGSAPVIESLSVTENGTYTAPSGVDGYSPVVVNVPSDEPVLDTLNVTANGTYTPSSGTDGYDEVVVNVSPALETKSITANGTYTPSTGKDGFSSVTVNVPEPTGTITLTENGLVNVANYAFANVNVSGGGGLPTGWISGTETYVTDMDTFTVTHNFNRPHYMFMIFKDLKDIVAVNKTACIVVFVDGTAVHGNLALTRNGANWNNISFGNSWGITVDNNSVVFDNTGKVTYRPLEAGTYTWYCIPFTLPAGLMFVE